jgi:transcriptional regulator with XRE-family HTH domain
MNTNPISGTTTAAAEFGRRLKAARLHRGEKQTVTAMNLGVDVATYSRWERGLHLPRADHMPRLTQVLGMSRSVLGLPEDGSIVAPSVSLVIGSTSGRSLEEDDDVRRREFLQSACGLLGATAFLDWDRLASLLGGQQLDGPLLDDLLVVTRSYASQWGEVAPTTLLPLVQRQGALLQTFLAAAPANPALAQRLYAVSSETATVAGWLSLLVENFGDARRYYNLARDLAREAEDGPRLAFALGASSSLFSRISSGSDPPRALALLEEADTIAGEQAPVHMRSWLSARLAEERAIQGDAVGSERHLHRAAAALASTSAKGEGIFVCCDPAWLAGFAGNCALLLGRPAVASSILEETLGADLALTSQRSAVLTDLGVAYAQQGEVERACELMGEAVAVASTARLAELLGRAHRARREHLVAWADSPAVRQLDEKFQLAVA